METKLNGLKAELDLEKEMYHVIYDDLIKELDVILNKWFINPFEATCTRRWFRENFSVDGAVDINFEVGFFNPKENRIDFGSDLWFCYRTDKQQLEVNYGTCGAHGKDEIYQVKRIKALAYVWEHIDEIEAELSEYSAKVTPIVKSHNEKIYEIEHEIRQIEHAIREENKKQLELSLHVGDIVTYAEDVNWSNKLFKDHVDTWKIHRICDKTIKVRADHLEATKQIEKNTFLNLMIDGKLLINGGNA